MLSCAAPDNWAWQAWPRPGRSTSQPLAKQRPSQPPTTEPSSVCSCMAATTTATPWCPLTTPTTPGTRPFAPALPRRRPAWRPLCLRPPRLCQAACNWHWHLNWRRSKAFLTQAAWRCSSTWGHWFSPPRWRNTTPNQCRFRPNSFRTMTSSRSGNRPSPRGRCWVGVAAWAIWPCPATARPRSPASRSPETRCTWPASPRRPTRSAAAALYPSMASKTACMARRLALRR